MIDFKQEAINIKPEIIEIRRQLHMHPELGMQEFKTSEFIKKILIKNNIVYKEVAKTGICAIIKGEKLTNSNKVIALRADIDGLPIQDKKVCSYSSKEDGRMHACGHDGHTAILLGVAKVLNGNKSEFSGVVKLFFEPAEETIGGARLMIDEGVLENPDVDIICGLHVEETIETGKIMIKEDVVNAASNPFNIMIKGSGGHGAYPQSTIDPIVIASNVVIALQNIISRELPPINPAVITVGSIHGGTAQNIIPDEVEISGIIRTLNNEDREYVVRRVEEITLGICKSFRAKAIIKIEESSPCLYNDKGVVKYLKNAASKIIGTDNIIDQKQPKMGVESFAYFAGKKPSAFYFLGSGNYSKQTNYPAHSSLFDIDEECLVIGVAIQSQIVYDYLN